MKRQFYFIVGVLFTVSLVTVRNNMSEDYHEVSTTSSPTTWFNDSFEKEPTAMPTHQNELFNSIKFLTKLNAFLVDIERLRRVDKAKLVIKNETTNVPDGIIPPSSTELSFGMLQSDVNEETLTDYNLFKLQCEMRISFCERDGLKIISHIYYQCAYVTIRISIFNNRGKFLWICEEKRQFSDTKWFGDVPRAMQRFGLVRASETFFEYYMPRNVSQFLFDYEVSQFLECNKTLVETNLKESKYNYTQNLLKNNKTLSNLEYVAGKFESLRRHYWLAAGTLLGWYRDCGIIPHTTDMDIGLRASDLDSYVIDTFKGDPQVHLDTVFGLQNDSFEMRLYGQAQFDVFVVYKHNSTHSKCGYHVGLRKYKRWFLSFDDLCSAEMLGVKVLVPCDPVRYLNYEYGKMEHWRTPKKSNYKWTNLDSNFSLWNEKYEWPRAIRLYHKNGKVNVNATLRVLNKHAKNLNLTTLPDF